MLFGVKSKFEQVINQNEEIIQIFSFLGLNNVLMEKVLLYFIIEEFNIAFITLCEMILLLVNLSKKNLIHNSVDKFRKDLIKRSPLDKIDSLTLFLGDPP